MVSFVKALRGGVGFEGLWEVPVRMWAKPGTARVFCVLVSMDRDGEEGGGRDVLRDC